MGILFGVNAIVVCCRGKHVKKRVIVLPLIGIASVLSAAAAQEMPGLDAASIEKRAHDTGASMSEFVNKILARANQEDPNAKEVADAGTKAFENAPDSVRKASIGGVDLGGAFMGQRGAAADVGPSFLAFASTSMPEDSLKRMIADVSKAGGVVVFRGMLPDGSKPFLAQLQRVVSDADQARVIVDPRLFRAFAVQEVPTYIAVSRPFELCDSLDCVSQPTPFDKISGNVTAQYALQTFVDGRGVGAGVAILALKNLVHEE